MKSDKVTILLVEDNEIDVKLAERAFRNRSDVNPMRIARDGIEALEILRGESGQEKLREPFLILLDLKMPRMGGLLCLEEIRNDRELRKSVVFVLTTSEDDKDVETAYGHQVAGYIRKQDLGKGMDNLIELIERYQALNYFPS